MGVGGSDVHVTCSSEHRRELTPRLPLKFVQPTRLPPPRASRRSICPTQDNGCQHLGCDQEPVGIRTSMVNRHGLFASGKMSRRNIDAPNSGSATAYIGVSCSLMSRSCRDSSRRDHFGHVGPESCLCNACVPLIANLNYARMRRYRAGATFAVFIKGCVHVVIPIPVCISI